MPPEGLTIDSLMAHPVMERTVVTALGPFGLDVSGLGRLTQGWSLMVWKIWLMGSLNGVRSTRSASCMRPAPDS